MKPTRFKRRFPPLAVFGAVLLVGAFAASIASNSLDSVAFWAGIAGAVLLVVGLVRG